ncbi:MAG: type II secretion system F family protein [Planctomycetaceae bacterium]
MDFEQLLPWAIFGGITFLLWFAFTQFAATTSRASERLDELRDPRLRHREDKEKRSGMGAMISRAAPTLSKVVQPKTELEQSALKVRLANAGFQSPNAPQIYLALKVALLILGVMIGGGVGLGSWGVTQKGLTSIIIGGGLGFYLPEIVVAFIRSSRREKIFLQLPDALDLLVVCVEAGLGLDAGMRRVSEELADASPEVCAEFAKSNLQLQMGRPRREVLHDLGIRTGVDDMKALAAILIQADKFGSSIAQALQKTAVKMIFPLVLFIFPGIFVVLVGPAAIMMINNLLTN